MTSGTLGESLLASDDAVAKKWFSRCKKRLNACPDGHVPCVSRIEKGLWYVGTNIPPQERLYYCKIIGEREPYPAPRN